MSVKKLKFENVSFSVPSSEQEGQWKIKVEICCKNFCGKTQELELQLNLAGKEMLAPVTDCPGVDIVYSAVLQITDVETWSMVHPKLYTAEAVLCKDGHPMDDLIDRFGFRLVEVEDRKILLNGRPVQIKGFCRHEDHPHYGCALPPAVIMADLQMIKDMGGNSVRTTHYPSDEWMLDFCDEMGILVWEENHARALNEEEMKELYEKIFKLLFYIKDEIILNQKSIPSTLKAHIILLKYFGWDYIDTKTFNIHDIDEKFLENDGNLLPGIDEKSLDSLINDLALNTVYLDNFEFKNPNELYISGMITSLFNEELNVQAAISDDDNESCEEIIDSRKLNFPQRDNYSLNFNYGFNHNFEIVIPIKYENTRISFRTNLKDFNENLLIDYNLTSRLSRISRFKLSKDYISFDQGDSILVKRRRKFDFISNELKTSASILDEKREGWRTGFVLRALHFISYPFFRNKKIWILMDLPYSADDNGLQLFKYINKIKNLDEDEYAKLDLSKDEIIDLKKTKVYFALEKSSSHYDNVLSLENEYIASSNRDKIRKLIGLDKASKEYEEIKRIGNVIPYKSLKHRLYSLYAELIVSSHPDNNIIYPFWGNYPHLAGLVKSKTVFLQHGVTKDDVSSWLNSFDKNLDLLVTVSESERESFLSSNYGYDEEIIKVLGFPRFDYLESLEDKREIIVMPTWRRQYHNFKDDEFKESNFFKTFNRLINDNDLLDYLEENEYRLVFKPHPNLNKFIKLFNKDKRVDFDLNDLNNDHEGYSSRRYSDIFNHSSLIVTDFSSVSFDFAYLKKPLIYYHYDNDYHFDSESGYFKYDEMGFGPVVNEHDDLINALKGYVDSNCNMEDVYKYRVDSFFKYNDKENCKRVYKELVELDKYY